MTGFLVRVLPAVSLRAEKWRHYQVIAKLHSLFFGTLGLGFSKYGVQSDPYWLLRQSNRAEQTKKVELCFNPNFRKSLVRSESELFAVRQETQLPNPLGLKMLG